MSYLRIPLAFLLMSFLFGLPAAAEKRVALVIGNSTYAQVSPLANPANDANDISSALKSAGFEVILGLNVDKREFDTQGSKLRRPAGKRRRCHLLLCRARAAGGGPQLPHSRGCAAAKRTRSRLRRRQSRFHLEADGARPRDKTNIVFLDACRDNPFTRNLARSMGTRSASIGKGLAQVDTGVGTLHRLFNAAGERRSRRHRP